MPSVRQLAIDQKYTKQAASKGLSINIHYLVLVEACELLLGDILVKSHVCIVRLRGVIDGGGVLCVIFYFLFFFSVNTVC